MAWRCETFREIAPTHTTGRESTPGPQYRSQHPNQAYGPGPPHHPPPLTASSPPPGKSAPPTAPQAPRASLESPGARRFTLYRPPLEQSKVRPVTGSAGHWSWSGPLVRASTAAPEFLRTHLLSGIQAGPQGATPPVSKICQNIFAGFAQTGSLSVGNISPLPALAWYAPNKELRKSGRPDGKG